MNRVQIFDAFRTFMGQPLNQSAVDDLDTFLDKYKPRRPVTSELTTSQAGVDIIKRFEGLHKKRSDGKIEAYPDPATGGDPWTIGWGSTGPHIKRGTVWTVQECDAQFRKHLRQFEEAVRRMVGQNATQGQFDALVSFAYNVGPENLRTSTLLRKHNEGNYKAAANEFKRWNKAAGKVMLGLTRRRAAERELYVS